jgi:hypothetical protein
MEKIMGQIKQILKNNFSAGIISQQLSGQIQLPVYQNGVEMMENFIINHNGSIAKRTGFKLIDDISQIIGKDIYKVVKFIFDEQQLYLIFFDEQYMYIVSWVDDKFIYINKYSHDLQQHELVNLKYTQNADVIYFTFPYAQPRKLIRNSATKFTLSLVMPEMGGNRKNPFEDGFPSCCCFYQGRLIYVGFSKKLAVIWASDMGYYDRFTEPPATEDYLDIYGFRFEIMDLKQKIEWISITIRGLMIGAKDGIVLCKSSTEGTFTAKNFMAIKINSDSTDKIEPITVGTSLLYVDLTHKRIKAMQYRESSDSMESINLSIFCPELINSNIKEICYQKDEDDLIYVLCEDNSLYYLLYSEMAGFWCWSKLSTKSQVKHLLTIDNIYGDYDLFILDTDNKILFKTKKPIFKKMDDFILESENEQELHNKYYDYIEEQIYDFNYLDYSKEYMYKYTNQITYKMTSIEPDGEYGTITATSDIFTQTQDDLVHMTIKNRTIGQYGEFEIRAKNSNRNLEVKKLSVAITQTQFNNWTLNKNILDGIDSIYNGKEIWVIGDGYIGQLIPINGKITLPLGVYVGKFKVGYGYTAFLKTMNITDTINNKNKLVKTYIRLYNSWGGQVGTDPFRMKDINYMKLQNARYNEPYTLMEQDVKVDYSDKWSSNKYFYVRHNEPMPFNINNLNLLEEIN